MKKSNKNKKWKNQIKIKNEKTNKKKTIKKDGKRKRLVGFSFLHSKQIKLNEKK